VLTIRYTPKPEDMLDAWRWLVLKTPAFHKARWVRALLPISMAILAMAIAIAAGARMGGSVIAAGFLLAIPGALGWNLWSEYPESAAARIGRDWAMRAPPSAFTGYSDLAHCVALWQGSTNCFVIPKRALAEEGGAELLGIVSRQLRVA
jgi:hypothetical protein